MGLGEGEYKDAQLFSEQPKGFFLNFVVVQLNERLVDVVYYNMV